MFKNLESMGVTYSKKTENSNTVVSIDISLSSLSVFLESQKIVDNTKLYIYNKDSKTLIASNTKSFSFDGIDEKKLDSLIDNQNKEVVLNDKSYLVSNIKLESKYTKNEYLVMLLDQYEMMKPYNEKIYIAMYASFILFIILLPTVWYASKIIINPMKLLEKENEKIRFRKFDDVLLINSNIKEINELSYSIVSMSQSIRKL